MIVSSAFLSLSSQTATPHLQAVAWNGMQSRILNHSHFKLSEDQKTITFKVSGVYQVHCRLAHTLNSQCLTLQIDGADAAQCPQHNENPGFQIFAQ
jgi:hypothetical protein